MKNKIMIMFLIFGLASCHTNPVNPIPDNPDIPTPDKPSVYVNEKDQNLFCNNNPWKMTMDTAWWINEKLASNTGELENYLNTRKNQGFNTIMFGCGGDWFDKTVKKPNENMFNRLNLVLDQIEARGMFAIPVIQIHQYNNGKPICVLPQSEATEFGILFGSRYGNRKSIAFWLVGGLDDKGVVSSQTIMNQALGIRSVDKNHLISFHPKASSTTIASFPISDVHQLALYQSYHTYDTTTLQQRMNEIKNSGVPFANIEGPFDEEGNIGANEINKVLSVCSKNGVFGISYGNNYVWQFSNWGNHMNSDGLKAFLKYKGAY